MFVRIQKLLSDDNLRKVDELVASGKFLDGKATAGGPTKRLKNNLQLDLASHPKKEEFLRLVNEVMNSHPSVRSAAVPRHMTAPIISKYEKGMFYGWHIDNPIMPGMGRPVRSDVSCTIFLGESADYDGGELVVHSLTGDVKIKPDRGDAVLYPSSYYHQVAEVTRGERLALLFWIQSMIADIGKRELLHDLEMAYNQILKDNPNSDALRMVQRA
ncbi:MAG TPA: Fe2+-dependent dioxygenase [Gammaproteobacteria bacterium]|jgi:PKHD-type hydroxylase|nr:Fe2+-dependent dioxygenase [Gammaproteobacteria bacterium]HAJ75505.1 Fe2+-dependent dioxygenase [Gammaproteobacteria bacterium]